MQKIRVVETIDLTIGCEERGAKINQVEKLIYHFSVFLNQVSVPVTWPLQRDKMMVCVFQQVQAGALDHWDVGIGPHGKDVHVETGWESAPGR